MNDTLTFMQQQVEEILRDLRDEKITIPQTNEKLCHLFSLERRAMQHLIVREK